MKNELVDMLAELEHEQWGDGFAKPLTKEEPNLSPERLKRWHTLWNTPYHQLPEEEKEKDRAWARKVLATLAERVPATKMNPSHGETWAERLSILFIIPFGIPLGVSVVSTVFNLVPKNLLISDMLGWSFLIGFFGLLLSVLTFLNLRDERCKRNEKVFFLRKFLGMDDQEVT